MSTHKHVDLLCGVLILAILAAVFALFLLSGWSGETAGEEKAYESGLFDTSTVHTLDITIDDWEGFLEECTDEEYVMCSVTIDGETVESVGIRAKGNTSMTSVESYGNDRYSFKLEFDHYQDGINYQGLDKLNLNNIIQDNTYMKDYLTYQMMDAFGVDSPLCSYIYLTVNGEDWGLYLAVEGVEESFLERNYGADSGALYKPDSLDMGGGRGAGEDFEMPEDFSFDQDGQSLPEDFSFADGAQSLPEDFDFSGEMPFDFSQGGAGSAAGEGSGQTEQPSSDRDGQSLDLDALPDGLTDVFGGMGSDDVKLIYTDDDYDSYSNIFDNAKTDVTDADKDRLIQSLKTLNQGEDVSSVVDVESVLRYFVVHNFVCNFDSYTGMMVHNYYLYEQDGVLSMIPWDYNLAFGGFQGGEDATSVVNDPIDTPVSGGSTEDRPMLAWIFNDETYTQQYHQLFQQFLTECFDSGAFAAEFDRVVELISPYVEKDPTKFCTYEEFETGVATLREFCQLRAESIQGQLDGTIPATSDGQQADSSALVDASHLSIAAMGSMDAASTGGGMGGGAFPGGGSFSLPSEEGDFSPPSGAEGAFDSFGTPPSSGGGGASQAGGQGQDAPAAQGEGEAAFAPSTGGGPPDGAGETGGGTGPPAST